LANHSLLYPKETGLEGGNYVKKTSKTVCDELGNDMNMIDYVEADPCFLIMAFDLPDNNGSSYELLLNSFTTL
jgi:hypothetical protein